MLTTYVKIIEATKPVFRRHGEELGEFLIVYVSPDTDRLKGLQNRGFKFGTCKTYEFSEDPRFFSLYLEEKFGNKTLMEYSNFVWEFCLLKEQQSDLEKLLTSAE